MHSARRMPTPQSAHLAVLRHPSTPGQGREPGGHGVAVGLGQGLLHIGRQPQGHKAGPDLCLIMVPHAVRCRAAWHVCCC